MRLLVTGGRFWSRRLDTYEFLDLIHQHYQVEVLIHGAAKGADTLCEEWAKERGIPTESYPADWVQHGRRAGPIRNKQMIVEGKPDLLVAFPGGKGTGNMKQQAKTAGIPIERWKP